MRFLTVLQRNGALSQIGPEVISPETEGMDPVEAARICRTRIESLLGQVPSG